MLLEIKLKPPHLTEEGQVVAITIIIIIIRMKMRMLTRKREKMMNCQSMLRGKSAARTTIPLNGG